MSRREQNRLFAAHAREYQADKLYKKEQNIDFMVFLFSLLLVLFSIIAFLCQPIMVSGDSMNPTLLSGERMLVEKVSYCLDLPKRGDILVCHFPGYRDNFVKRVVGLPGETVEVRDGLLYIDGMPLDESGYWRDVMWRDTEPYTVEEGAVFVMGDNRNHSEDSRVHGAIDQKQIVGRSFFVFWPFTGFRAL